MEVKLYNMEEKKLIVDPNEIKLTTHNEIDQILGNPPGWILKWGLSIVFLVVIIFISMSWMVKYPDIIQSEVIIATENPAIRVIAENSGRISKLLVKNNEIVSKGEILGILDNPAQLKDIKELEKFINKIELIENPKKFLKNQIS